MVKAEGKGKAPMSKSKPKEKDAGKIGKIEVAASEPVKMDPEAPAVVSRGEEKKEENKKEETKLEEKIEITPNKRANNLRKKNRNKKTALGDADAVAANDGDKQGPSDKKKVLKKAESMGMIFMCSSKTKQDCYRYNVFGLPASKKEMVVKIYRGMRLFLFDIDLKLMYGIYKAAGPGGFNIEPKAFKSAFPSQVRFTVLEDCLPLAEEKFKAVIKGNYYGKNKFDCQLNPEQVKNLCKLFLTTTGPKSKQVGRSGRTEARAYVDRDRIRRQGRGEVRHPALGRDNLFPPGSHMYEREAFASPVPPPTLPPPLPPPSYVYRRPLDMDYYGRDVHLEHHDRRILDFELRRRESRGEIEYRDPYSVYRGPPPYRDPPYAAALPPGYDPLPIDPLYRY